MFITQSQADSAASDLVVIRTRDTAIAGVFGLLTGAAAGLIGVGGGEFRMPLLIHLFRHNVKSAAGVNLVVGLVTVCLSLFTRWRLNQFYWGDTALALTFSILSLAGALVGARQA